MDYIKTCLEQKLTPYLHMNSDEQKTWKMNKAYDWFRSEYNRVKDRVSLYAYIRACMSDLDIQQYSIRFEDK